MKIEYYNYCKTCFHGWTSPEPEPICPQCFTSNVVTERKEKIENK